MPRQSQSSYYYADVVPAVNEIQVEDGLIYTEEIMKTKRVML